MNLPKQSEEDRNQFLFISEEGMNAIQSNYDHSRPHQGILWTTQKENEIPISLDQSGFGSLPPETLIESFSQIVKACTQWPALSYKADGIWKTFTYQSYYEECENFARALISLQIGQQQSICILGSNSPYWAISFFGSMFGFYIPVGVYPNNHPQACEYVFNHSQCELVVVDKNYQLCQVLQIWHQLPNLKYVVMYGEKVDVQEVPIKYQPRILDWSYFIQKGMKNQTVETQKNEFEALDELLKKRKREVKPGNCCTIVYTSGTTGPPKGVMLSHDNFSWTGRIRYRYYLQLVPTIKQQQQRVVSYLPLSHSAAQIYDLIGPIVYGGHVFYADDKALQGTLIQTLQEARPTLFLGVPRIWEKFYDALVQRQNSFPESKQKIYDWAKIIGIQGTYAEFHKKQLPKGWEKAKKEVFNEVQQFLGLDKAQILVFGAAPLSFKIRRYFLSLNIYLRNGFGMSETSGPQFGSDPRKQKDFDSDKSLRSTGYALWGTQAKICHKSMDKDGFGQMIFRGRNRFMGYLNDEAKTLDTIDDEGFIHSGDVGQIDQNGSLEITGRIKELIITSGGENVAPVLIQDVLKEEIPFISNCIVCGDQRKFLTVLFTLQFIPNKEGQYTGQIDTGVLKVLKSQGVEGTTLQEFENDNKFIQTIQQGIDRANNRSISRAQQIQQFRFIPGDFSVDGGELTPSLKLRRKETIIQYEQFIDSMYSEISLFPKL